MITFTCPACKAVCSLGDEFAGRKMKCPKCRTRIRHHKDGPIEVLSMGEVPPPSAPIPPSIATQTTTAAPAAPGAPSGEKGSTVDIPVVPDMVKKLVSQSESKQNTIVIAGVIGFFCLALSAIGLLTKEPILAIAPIALGLASAFVWLFIRVKRREAFLAKPAAPRTKPGDAPGDKTEPIAKS